MLDHVSKEFLTLPAGAKGRALEYAIESFPDLLLLLSR